MLSTHKTKWSIPHLQSVTSQGQARARGYTEKYVNEHAVDAWAGEGKSTGKLREVELRNKLGSNVSERSCA